MFSLFSATAVAELNTPIKNLERGITTIAGGSDFEYDTLSTTLVFDPAIINHGVRSADTSYTNREDVVSIQFESPDQVLAESGGSGGSDRLVRWEMREFFKFAVEKQITFWQTLSSLSANVTDKVFDAGRTVLQHAGQQADNTGQNIRTARCGAFIPSSNLVTLIRGFNDVDTVTPAIVLTEFNPGILKTNVYHGSITIPSGSLTASLDVSSLGMDFNNVQVFWGGFSASDGFQSSLPMLYYNGSGSMVAEKMSTTGTIVVYFSLAEFWPKWVKSKGRGIITVPTGAANANAAISPTITQGKTIVEMLGFVTDTAAANMNTSHLTLTRTSGSQFDADRVSVSGVVTSKLSYDYTEFL